MNFLSFFSLLKNIFIKRKEKKIINRPRGWIQAESSLRSVFFQFKRRAKIVRDFFRAFGTQKSRRCVATQGSFNHTRDNGRCRRRDAERIGLNSKTLMRLTRLSRSCPWITSVSTCEQKFMHEIFWISNPSYRAFYADRYRSLMESFKTTRDILKIRR